MFNVRGMDFDEAWDKLQDTPHESEPLEHHSSCVIFQDKEEGRVFDGIIGQHFAGKPIRNIMEIGSFVGGGLAVVSRHITVEGGLAIAIEPEYDIVFEREAIQEAISPVRLIHLPLASQDKITERLVQQLVTYHGLIDILIIDGCHLEEEAVQDFTMYYDHVNTPGLIMFHDTKHDPVNAAFQRCAENRVYTEHNSLLYGLSVIYKGGVQFA